MNWFNQTTTIDSYIANDIYNSSSTQGEGIDLRVEMHNILYGTGSTRPKGHWIVYRRFDRTQKSDFFSERTKEGVGGPAYIYTDELLRTRRVPTDRTGLPLDPLKLGEDNIEKYLYYLEYTISPKIGDIIFELEWDNHTIQPTLGIVEYKDKYIIKRKHDYRLENGNIQYYIVSTIYDEVGY